MRFEDVLKRYFDVVYTEVDFVKKTYNALKEHGFTDENTIAAVCICRDEISQSIMSIIKNTWGEPFNLASLAGMFSAGKTALMAAMHHSPIVGGKERYVFYALPHIAIDAEGHLGSCKRAGREGESVACGALNAFQNELYQGRLDLSINETDSEQGFLKRRLLSEIPYGHVPDLLELTRIAQRVIQKDLENVLTDVVDKSRSDYAVITGIQIHGPKTNYVCPTKSYMVVNEVFEHLEI